MILAAIIKQYDFNLAYAKALVADLSDDEMTIVASRGLVNHPAFTLGHLVSGSAILAEDLGVKSEMPQGWKELFLRKGPGDPRLPEIRGAKYPSKEALISELDGQHELVKKILLDLDDDRLAEPFQWRFSSFMPTLLDLITFLCINHEAMHLGQLAAWRREMGKDSALAKMK